jgi:hypothetical protein
VQPGKRNAVLERVLSSHEQPKFDRPGFNNEPLGFLCKKIDAPPRGANQPNGASFVEVTSPRVAQGQGIMTSGLKSATNVYFEP